MKNFWSWWDKQASWWRSHSLVWWGGYLTALYVGAVICMMAARFNELLELPLNSLGDFSAGVFGPMAFLWLILGYKQQGDELKASSGALKEQVAELRHSMELQRLNAEKQDLMIDPVLYLNYVETKVVNGKSVDSLVITNKGEACRDVYIDSGGGVPFQSRHTHVLGRDTQYSFEVDEVALDTMIGVVITYVRLNGSKSRQGFHFYKPKNGSPKTFAFPEKTEAPEGAS